MVFNPIQCSVNINISGENKIYGSIGAIVQEDFSALIRSNKFQLLTSNFLDMT